MSARGPRSYSVVRFAAPGARGEIGKLRDAAFDQVAHLGGITSGRAADDELGGNDVARFERAAGDVADADDRRVERGDVPPDDALQAEDEMRLGIGDVHRPLRRRAAVAAGAAEGHGPVVGGREHRPSAGGEGAGLHAGRVVQAVDRLARKALEEAVPHHGERAAAPLFRGLEDEMERPAEIRVLGEVPGRAEEHRRVPVMPAGVHLAGMDGGVGAARPLLERERVHIGAQADRALAGKAAADRRDDAGAADALRHLDAPFAKLAADERGGAVLLHSELGMGMDVAPDLREFGMMGVEPRLQAILHWFSLGKPGVQASAGTCARSVTASTASPLTRPANIT